MSFDNKEEFLNVNNKITDVFPNMQGAIIDKFYSKKMNIKSLDFIYDDYEKNYKGNEKLFTEISLDQDSEEYRMMPKYMKMELKNYFGDKKIMVRKRMRHIVFGTITPTILEVFDKSSFLKSRYKTRRVVQVAEALWIDMIKLQKVGEIIKTPKVWIQNIMSNIYSLENQGGSLVDILKKMVEGNKFLNDYQYLAEKIDLLQAKIDSGQSTNVDLLTKLEDRLSENPVHELIKEGVYQSIQEDISSEDTKNRITDYATQNKIWKKTPKFIKDSIGLGFIGEDSKLYKWATLATQRGDFLSRFVSYDFESSKLEGLKGKKRVAKKKEILQRTMDMFVNYDTPTNKWLSYTNKIGLTMYTKFFLNNARIVYRLGKENPSKTLYMHMMQNLIADVPDISDTYDYLGSRVRIDPVDHFVGAVQPRFLTEYVGM